MSLKESAFSGLNSVIFTYINMISQKYNIDSEELKMLWEGSESVVIQQQPLPTASVVTPSSLSSAAKELEILTKTQLIEMCKTKNLKVSGNKTELIARILEVESKTQPVAPAPVVRVGLPQQPQIIKKLVEKIPKLEIKRNAAGYFVHAETSFVFDTKTQKVYGKLIGEDKIEELTAEDIDICNKYKFSYILPNNLDKKINILDVKVDELDDDVELEDELDDEFNEDEEEIELEEDEYYEE
jgi:hypothetical protein